MQKKNRGYVFTLICLVILMAVGGCSWFKGPQQKPETKPPAPKQQQAGNEPDISVYMHETGEKKSMKMEEYIAGVVAGEMKNDWPLEALAAQAILARTFTLQKIEEEGGVPARGTQASTDIKEFQAYSAGAVNDNVRKAVDMTRGMIITYQNQPIRAWFHASAGGITATAKEGLDFKEDEPPYIQSVQSPDDLAPDDVKNWTAEFTKQEVMEAMRAKGKSVEAIDRIEIQKKGPSGRALSFLVNGNTEISGPELRVALDSTKLKSMLLDKVEIAGNSVRFTGKGYGHGVGMSQWGAYKMAKEGKKPEDIINYYFKNITLEKRWE